MLSFIFNFFIFVSLEKDSVSGSKWINNNNNNNKINNEYKAASDTSVYDRWVNWNPSILEKWS